MKQNNSEKRKPRDDKKENKDSEKQTSSHSHSSDDVEKQLNLEGFQPTLHRKPFADKSRMPLSSEEYEDDDFEIDGE